MRATNLVHLAETDSTNQWAAEHDDGTDLVVWTDYQTAGRGCGENSWESGRALNLLFSMLIHPSDVSATAQFRISMAIALAVVRELQCLLKESGRNPEEISIKWPNDIYWNDYKLGGILIENRLSGANVRVSIIGVGLNVNQTVFTSDAPNPVSLCQITGREYDRETLLRQVVECFTLDIAPEDYRALLYRRQGCHTYTDSEGTFMAKLLTVEDDGHLLLADTEGRHRRYAFKEVSFVLPTPPTLHTTPTTK